MARGVDPAEAARVLKILLDTWDLASERMLDTVARRLARGITDPGWAEQKAREVLALRGELAGVIGRVEQATPTMVLGALDEAYRIGEGAAGVLEQTHIRSRPEVVQQLATRLVTRLQGAQLPVISSHTDLFRRAVSESELLMQTGTLTRRDAVARTVDQLLVQGADRFRDESGRRWHLDSYARMAGRTMAGQTAVQGQLDVMVAEGDDLVVISDSPRECASCQPWEGRLLSVSGASVGQKVDGRQVTGTVAEARSAGLWHPNCTHRADPFTPGLTVVREPDSNPGGYEEQQQLRALERRARDLKRRQVAAERLGDTDTARQLRAQVRANSTRIREHTERTGQLRRRDRESVVENRQPRTTPSTRTPRPAVPTAQAADQMVGRVSVSRQDTRRMAREQAEKQRAADLNAMTDGELDARLTRATEQEEFDDLDAVVGEMERRERLASAAAERAEQREKLRADQEAAQWQRFDQLTDQGWDEESAVAEVFGRTVAQQRRDRAITQLRGDGYTGKGFDELARKAFRDEIYQRYLAAETATRGHMVTPAAQRAGVDPRSLFTGTEARARKHASDELKEWWDNHGRVTYDRWVAELLGDTQAARDARFRTGGEGFLR